jgi:hypothetical protein
MSPRFGMASPCRASSRLSSDSGVPALTRISFDARLSETSPDSPDRSSRMPVVAAAEVNECPDPTGLTVVPVPMATRTASATASVLVGRTTAAAVAFWLPAQFCQAVRLPMGCEYPSYIRGVNSGGAE